MRFFFLSQAGKLIANLIVMGSTIIGRAMLQAYRKGLNIYSPLAGLPPLHFSAAA
jgi:hypothetical protein